MIAVGHVYNMNLMSMCVRACVYACRIVVGTSGGDCGLAVSTFGFQPDSWSSNPADRDDRN